MRINDDLISRAAAIGCLGNSPEQMCMPWSEVERMLRELPAVDAAPVVRCRDCKYSDTFYSTTTDTMPLKCLNIRYGGVMPDWYCEHGERREDE